MVSILCFITKLVVFACRQDSITSELNSIKKENEDLKLNVEKAESDLKQNQQINDNNVVTLKGWLKHFHSIVSALNYVTKLSNS